MVFNIIKVMLVFVCSVWMLPGWTQPTEVSADDMVKQLAPLLTRNFSIQPTRPSTPPASGVAANPEVNGSRPSLSLQVNFEYGSSRIQTDSKPILSQLAQALASEQLQKSKFLLEGHTDASGNASANQSLSLLRARAVRDFLSSKGIESVRLVAVGKGSSDLANSSDPSAPENRRVRIVNLN